MSKVAKKCEYCEQSMLVRQADLNRGWGKYCSKSCKAKHQVAKGGYGKPKTYDDVLEDIGHPLADGYFGHGQY